MKNKIDMWYGDRFAKGKYYADAFFGPDGYSGNIYDATGKAIGDYRTWDSTWIEKAFKMQWCNA